MIIYMLLNEVTEKVYIGKSINSLPHRLAGHLDAVQSGSTSRLHAELKRWPEECWTAVILQHCYSEEELALAEGNWIAATEATDPAVGYNSHYVASSADIAMNALTSIKRGRKDSEFFAACGRKGAAKVKRRADMTPEEIERFREWGRKGAAKSRALVQSALLRPRPVGTALDRVHPELMTVARARGFHRGAARFPVCTEPLRHRDRDTPADDRLLRVALLGGHDLSIS